MIRKCKGNMYGFVTATWNIIKGKCQHDCSYCYMKKFKQNPIRFDEKSLNIKLGNGNIYFVGSGTDIWADNIPYKWIYDILCRINSNWSNTYFFQTKNSKRFSEFEQYLYNKILCITLETNRVYKCMGNTPNPIERVNHFTELNILNEIETHITIEPILDFDLEKFIDLLHHCNPNQINIGADSMGHNLPEPPKEKIIKLIKECEKFTKVYKKSNLNRLLK